MIHYPWAKKIVVLNRDMEISSCVGSGLEKKNQDEWKIIMLINRADELRSLFSTAWQEDLYRSWIGIHWCWWLFLLIVKKEVSK